MKKVQDANTKNKNVLIRIDTDVTFKSKIKNQKSKNEEQNREIESDSRLRASIPTLKLLLENGAKVTIIGHVGRPKGKEVSELKMRPVEDKLIELLGTHQNWQILENLRFNPGEESNDSEFARQLAAGQDIFVQDAFATCHRAHASTSKVAEVVPSYAGLSVQKEIENLDKLTSSKEKPFTVILGGAKISDKLPVIKNLISRADNFLIGGAIANAFLASRRHYLGKSLVEPDSYREANIIWQEIMDETDKNIYLPTDVLISKSIDRPEDLKTIDVARTMKSDAMSDHMIVDIGPKTIQQYEKVIIKAKRIFFNGNMGVSEVPAFSEGTNKIIEIVANSPAQVVIGGGDTISAYEKLNLPQKDNVFLSTGGGTTLEYLAGKQLPGLKALE